MNVYEWRQRFFRKHGGVGSAIVEYDRDDNETGFFLFPDGARCEASREGGCIDPPDDEVKRLKLVIRYREEIVKRVEYSFTDLKQQIAAIHNNAPYCGVIPNQTPDGFDLHNKPEAMQVLKKARANVIAKRHELDEARRQLGKLTSPTGKQRRLQREADRQEEQEQELFTEELDRTRI